MPFKEIFSTSPPWFLNDNISDCVDFHVLLLHIPYFSQLQELHLYFSEVPEPQFQFWKHQHHWPQFAQICTGKIKEQEHELSVKLIWSSFLQHNSEHTYFSDSISKSDYIELNLLLQLLATKRYVFVRLPSVFHRLSNGWTGQENCQLMGQCCS